ncbi:6386_t:CDS:10, partial [Entrophospora sp. SA101]
MSAFNTNTAISFTNNNNNPQGNEIEFERISHTLNSLIKHFLLENVNNFNGKNLKKNEITLQQKRIFDYCMRILGSRMTPSIVNDEVHISDLIKKKLIRDENQSSSKALRFTNLFSKLQSKKIITQKWGILYFLLSISDQAGSDKNLKLVNTTPIEQMFSHPNKEISEAQLLRDIVFVLQGIEGQHIKFEKGSSSYIIDSKMTITYSTRDLLHRLTELGWLYRRVNEYVKINFNDPSIGLVGQAFSSALQRELTEYYKFIATIEAQVSKPFFEMLQRWIYEGELEDPFEEFFVACDPNVEEEDLWQSKYKIRKDMQPTFISSLLAKKIFSIGKSLNFIRYSCNDNDWIINNAKPTGADKILKYGDIIGLESSIDNAYKTTSKQLMNLLFAKYKLKEHLIAIKRYLLLGQGDFIQHLMPANTLYRHNLTGTLEAAIRASNAQYDDPDILRRLDVRLLEISYGDVGWDVFSLDYYVDSPINTILTPSAMNQYLKLFNFLWRLKHVEHDLSFAWRRNMTSARTLHQIEGKVVECSWDELVTNINKKCVDLDSLIEAHNKYLTNLTSKCFLNTSNNQNLFSRLLKIFEYILQYKNSLDELYNFTIKELMHRENINIVSEIRQGKSRNLGDTDEEKSSFLSDDSKEKLKPIQARFNEIAGLFKNSPELKKRLLSHDSELSYAFVDAKV